MAPDGAEKGNRVVGKKDMCTDKISGRSVGSVGRRFEIGIQVAIHHARFVTQTVTMTEEESLNTLKIKENWVCSKRMEQVFETCRAGQILPFSRRDLSSNPADNVVIFGTFKTNNTPATKHLE